MIGLLKKLAGMEPDRYRIGYIIWKYPHPDSKSKPEVVGSEPTLEKAQELCARPESSYKEGDTSNWWFLGYVPSSSKTGHLTIWDALR